MIRRIFLRNAYGLVMAFALSGIAAAQEGLPVSLISYNGERPAPLSADNPLLNSIGVLFAPEKPANPESQYDDYATAFLISECYALAGSAIAGQLAVSERMFGGSTIELIGVRFGIGLKPGFDLTSLSDESFRATWPVTAHTVVPRGVDDALFETTRWWLLHLDGCETGDEKNGTALAFDPVTSMELRADGLPRVAKHIGALMTDQVSLVELPCQILGPMRRPSWETTCSSWLGMMGGPVLTFDAERKAWTAIGIVPIHNPALLLMPSGRLASGKRSFDVYEVDEKNPRFFDYTTNMVPMAQIWSWVRDLVEADRPGLLDPSRANVAEESFDLKQSLLMEMREKPEESWSAFDYTRFALGLEALRLDHDAAKFFKSALVKDPTYLPAAARLSLNLELLGPWGMSDGELEMLRGAMGDIVAKYPEDPQMILRRIFVNQKLELDSAIIEDGERFLSASVGRHAPSMLHVDLGMAHLGLGDLIKAREAFAKALQMDAQNVDAVLGLARIALFDGRVEDAVRLAEKAAKLGARDAGPALFLAIARAQAADLDGALAVLEEAGERYAYDASIPAYLAMFRGYKRAIDGELTGGLLLSASEASETYEGQWPREIVEVFLGTRTRDSIAGIDYSSYTPDWRRSIRTGTIALMAAYDLSQGRKIDIAEIENGLAADKSRFSAHLAPILADWAARVAASNP